MNGHYLSYYLQRDHNNFDLMRLLMALLVIAYHAPTLAQIPNAYLTSPLFNFGGMAVGFFFFLSGLVVTNSFLSRSSIIYYTTSRIFRIWPALITVIIISVFIIGPLVTSLPLDDYFTHKITRHYLNFNLKLETRFLLPGVFETNLFNAGVNGSIWTIHWEVKAYFALILLLYPFARKNRAINITLLALFLIGLFSGAIEYFLLHTPYTSWLPLNKKDLVLSDGGLHPVWYTAKSYFILFFIGSFLCSIKDKLKFNFITFIFSILLYITCCYSFANHALLAEKLDIPLMILFQLIIFLQMLCFSMVLMHIAFYPRFVRFKPKSDVSYGVYIWAFPLAQIIEFYLPNLNLLNNIILVSISSILVGSLSWHYIEKPALNLGKNVSFFLTNHYLNLKNRIIKQALNTNN